MRLVWAAARRERTTFACGEVLDAERFLGEELGPDEYRAQQSIRTFFNTSAPERHYVKTALSVLNMGFLRERAAVGYRATHYARASPKGSPYRKMLAALWRESPVPRLGPGERLATMASLLHTDARGRSRAGELIRESGLEPAVWPRRYLVPLLHAFHAHDLVFMPTGRTSSSCCATECPSGSS